MPDVVLSCREEHAHAALANYGSATPFGPPVGVEIHSTGGTSASPQTEYAATVSWFRNPASGVSAQRVVGPDRVNTSVHDAEVAWHGRDPDNHRRHSIELAHPATAAGDATAYLDFQYEAAGELIARWHLADAAAGHTWPLRLLSRDELAANPLAAGIAYHKDTPNGVADGKRDPTGPLDGARLLATAERYVAQLAPPAPFNIDAARDQLWSIAEQCEQGGWPWLGQGVKSAVALSKGER